MAFESIKQELNVIIKQEGVRIYNELLAKYPEKTVEHKDILLNSLCFALVHLLKLDVSADDHPIALQLIHKVLSNNL